MHKHFEGFWLKSCCQITDLAPEKICTAQSTVRAAVTKSIIVRFNCSYTFLENNIHRKPSYGVLLTIPPYFLTHKSMVFAIDFNMAKQLGKKYMMTLIITTAICGLRRVILIQHIDFQSRENVMFAPWICAWWPGCLLWSSDSLWTGSSCWESRGAGPLWCPGEPPHLHLSSCWPSWWTRPGRGPGQ